MTRFLLPLATLLALSGCDFGGGFDPTPPDVPLPALGTCVYTVTDEDGETTRIEQLARFNPRLDSGSPAIVICDEDGQPDFLEYPYLRLSGVNADEFLTAPIGATFSPIANYFNEGGGSYPAEEGAVVLDVRDGERIGGRFRLRMELFAASRPPEVVVEGAFLAPVPPE